MPGSNCLMAEKTMTRRFLLLIPLTLLFLVPARAANKTIELAISAGEHDRFQTPINLLLRLPRSLGEIQSATVQPSGGAREKAQITRPGLLNERAAAKPDEQLVELHFFLPSLSKGQTTTVQTVLSTEPPVRPDGFDWFDVPIQQMELRYMSRPSMRYVFRTLDDSSPEGRAYTAKPFHHLYDPNSGGFVTKGPGGLYTQERGIFYGFNKITYGDGKKADVWDCTGDAHQAHVSFLEQTDGPIIGRHQMEISWRGEGKEEFATEHREVTLYNTRAGRMLDFASRLESRAGKVRLDGDPQHAGFHFRVDNSVAVETKAQTVFIRPDGRGKPGETRSWPADKAHVNLPWDAMFFVLGEQRYTLVYVDRPQNPKEARFSEGDYGRIGSSFAYELDANRPLEVAYRLWLQTGSMEVPQAAGKAADFADPPQVVVKGL